MQLTVPFLRVLDGHGVSPLQAEGLNELPRLAFDSGCVGHGADVPESEGVNGLGDPPGDVGGAVVAHHAAARPAPANEPGNGTAEKADHRWLLLIRQHLEVRQSGGVVDGDMDLVVADLVGAPQLAITGDAVAHLLEPRRGLDIDLESGHLAVPTLSAAPGAWDPGS